MNDWERAFTKWVNMQFNDYYIMLCPSFENGFYIVDHHAPIITQAFIRLIHNMFPWTMFEPTPYAASEEYFTLFIDGVQLTIKPYDNEICHTEYITEEVQ